MKILVLSLLRLGDLLMHQEIVETLENRYPDTEFDLLIQESCRHALPLLEKSRKTHFFPRAALQDQLVLKDKSFFKAYLDLRTWSVEIRKSHYTHVIDLTHTRFSKALIEALEIPEWAESKKSYLNEIFADCTQSSFHYVDALYESLQVMNPGALPEAEIRDNSVIVIQPLTSDSKKNWSLQSFQELIGLVRKDFPEVRFQIVGSPQERDLLARHFTEDKDLQLKICDLCELRDILKASRLLVSGDTATLHLATLTRTPSLGIYLGSAEPSKTAPRLNGALVLQSHEACVPCRHSSKCPQPEHLCGNSISADAVHRVLRSALTGDQKELTRQAWEATFSISEVGQNSTGYLTLRDLAQGDSDFQQGIRQQTFHSRYTKVQYSLEKIVADFSGELWELSLVVEEKIKHTERLFEVIRDLQGEVRSISKACIRMDKKQENHGIRLSPLVKEFGFLSEDPEWTSVLEAALLACAHETSFAIYRRWRTLIDDLVGFTEVQNEIYLRLRSYLHERGVYYVPGSTRTT